MCQAAMRRLLIHSESRQVRKVASLLTEALKLNNSRGRGFYAPALFCSLIYRESSILKGRDRSLREGIVEVRVATLMDNLALALMQASNLAADSPEYETLAYALDLAELGLSVESNTIFDSLEPPEAH